MNSILKLWDVAEEKLWLSILAAKYGLPHSIKLAFLSLVHSPSINYHIQHVCMYMYVCILLSLGLCT